MRIASPFGIPFRLHWSFFGLVVWIVGFAVYQVGWNPGLLIGSLLAVGLSLSVGLHELGHALAALGGWIFLATNNQLAMAFVMTNLIMGAFNLIPAFPMDGGRVLRAILTKWMGFIPASRLSVRIGRVFAWGFLIGGAYWWNPGLVMVGAFLHIALNAEKARLIDLNWQRTTGSAAWWNTEQPEAPPSAWIVQR